VIEDLDGGVSEPTRRWRVALVSAAIAAASLVLLVVLIAPPIRFGEPPQAASPSPSARASLLMTARSNPLTNLPFDLTHASLCPDGSFLTPPYLLVIEAETGRILAGVFDGNSVPHVVALNLDAGTGEVTVTCAADGAVTPDMFDATQTWEFDVR
jgi:hypothetical protein